MATNRKMDVWGAGVPRKQTSVSNRRQPLAWDRQAAREGVRYRVFTLSMGDVMDGEVPHAWREELYDLIDSTPNLDWQLLTKRPENYLRFLPEQFKHNNVWFGTTAESQAYFDARWKSLSKLRERFPEAPLWISYEPALGPITLAGKDDRPDWVIFGGESGSGFRQMETGWAESMLAECRELGVAFFMKQMSSASLPTAKKIIPDNLKVRQYPGDMNSPFVILEDVRIKLLPGVARLVREKVRLEMAAAPVDAMSVSEKRREAAKKAVATRTRNMQIAMEAGELTIVAGKCLAEIYDLAFRNHGGNYQGEVGPFFWSNSKARNAIRHRLTNYEEQWSKINRGSTGSRAYDILRERVDALVDQTYPEFAPGMPHVEYPTAEMIEQRRIDGLLALEELRKQEIAAQTAKLTIEIGKTPEEVYIATQTNWDGTIAVGMERWNNHQARRGIARVFTNEGQLVSEFPLAKEIIRSRISDLISATYPEYGRDKEPVPAPTRCRSFRAAM